MTLEELNALFDLRAELEELTEIRRSLMDAATKTTTKLTGMPHGSGVTDKITNEINNTFFMISNDWFFCRQM